MIPDSDFVHGILRQALALELERLAGVIPPLHRRVIISGPARVTIQGASNFTNGWLRYSGPQGEWSANLIKGVRVGKPARDVYAHEESNDLASGFRAIDARTSRLDGLQSALGMVDAYYEPSESPAWNRAYMRNLRAVIERMIAEERAKPRPVGIAFRPRVRTRARRTAKVAA